MEPENITGYEKPQAEFSSIGERNHTNRQNSSAKKDEVIIGLLHFYSLQFIMQDHPAQFRCVK